MLSTAGISGAGISDAGTGTTTLQGRARGSSAARVKPTGAVSLLARAGAEMVARSGPSGSADLIGRAVGAYIGRLFTGASAISLIGRASTIMQARPALGGSISFLARASAAGTARSARPTGTLPLVGMSMAVSAARSTFAGAVHVLGRSAASLASRVGPTFTASLFGRAQTSSPPGTTTAQIAVNASAHQNQTVSSYFVTLTTTAPCLIYVALLENGGPGVSVVGSSLGTFSLRKSQISSAGSPYYEEVWTKYSPAALTAETITVTQTSSAFLTIDAVAFSGVSASTPFDGNASLPAGVTAGNPSVSTNAGSTCIVGAFRSASGVTQGAGSGYTAISDTDYQLVEYRLVSSPQSGLAVTTGGTDNGAIGDALVAASSKAPGGTLSLIAALWGQVAATMPARAVIGLSNQAVLFGRSMGRVVMRAVPSGIVPLVGRAAGTVEGRAPQSPKASLIGRSLRASGQMRSTIGLLTNILVLIGRATSTAVARIAPSGTVPLLGRMQAGGQARGMVSGALALVGRGASVATGGLRWAGGAIVSLLGRTAGAVGLRGVAGVAAPLLARGASSSVLRAAPRGLASMSGQGAASGIGRGSTIPFILVQLLGRSLASLVSRIGAPIKAAFLSGRGAGRQTGRAAPVGTLTLTVSRSTSAATGRGGTSRRLSVTRYARMPVDVRQAELPPDV